MRPVAAWECDAFAHLTIAYYFARLEDASVAVLDELPGGGAARTGGLYVRLMKEFRAADLIRRGLDEGGGAVCVYCQQAQSKPFSGLLTPGNRITSSQGLQRP